ncbi:hypothetical protein B0H14DRAFT_3046243 [Mycena olivaceomarginata]|nr:hypothetical protein B0H14DRAFT_3046243 [Mycena olivaceomarginata]
MTPSACAGCMSPCLLHLAFHILHARRRLPGITAPIRIRTPTPPYVSTLSPPTPPGMPPMGGSMSFPRAPVRTSPTSGGNRKSTRGKRRSPMKGLFLFPFSLSSAPSASTTQTTMPCPIRVPLPPLVSVDGPEGEEEDDQDEDAWVDKDDDDDEGKMGR